jgi:predicted acetyltransferase
VLELVQPEVTLFAAWAEAHREWGPGLHEDGFGISANDDVEIVDGFRVWVDALKRDRGLHWWIIEDGRVVGGIALRAFDDERVTQLGHVGYGIRPSARGRGIATWALGRVLTHAACRTVDPLIAICHDDNEASIGTLEHHGATLLSTELRGGVRVRRYAIPNTD